MRRALTCLGHALKWDDDWARRARLIWAFSMDNKKILNSFDLGPFKRQPSSAAGARSSTGNDRLIG
jgi:hypothetical protein